MSLFVDIIGQDVALVILREALAEGAGHAYLFVGPGGVGKNDAGLAFAAGLACPLGGCGSCECCRRVREGIHPDVEIVSPPGRFITIEQIREINAGVALRPFEARVKVYLILDAEAMNREAANALLRTLEEPPPHVHFILVSDQPEELPLTVVSRCQRVPFTRTPVVLIMDHLREAYGLSELDATAFARVAQGNLAYARELASQPVAREQRARLLDWARRLPEGSFLQADIFVDQIMGSVEAKAEARAALLAVDRERDLGWAGNAQARARVNRLYDQRVRREMRRAVDHGLDEVLRVFAGWYRDLLVVALGAEDAVLNYDYLFDLEQSAFASRIPAYVTALGLLGGARELFRYNVEAQLALKDLVFTLKEALS